MKALFFILLLLLGTAISALAGNELGNGGDLVAQEFIAAGRKLVQRLRETPDARIPEVDQLAEAVEKVKVTSAGSLTLHGAEVDAINYPEEREIDVSRPRWEAANPEKRASLVLHEYLGILQVNDLHYEISGSYASPFAVEEKQKKFEIGLGTSFGWQGPFQGWHIRSSAPGLSVQFGYLLSERNELLLQVDRQTFNVEMDETADTETKTGVMAGWKHWLNSSKTWRPYILAGAGYSWTKWSETGPGGKSAYGQTLYYKYNYDARGDFALQLGTGVRYSLLRDVGLDLGVTFRDIGEPWHWSNDKVLFGNAGLSVLF